MLTRSPSLSVSRATPRNRGRLTTIPTHTCTPAHTRSRRSALPLTRLAPRILAATTECQIAQQMMSPSTPRSRHLSGTCSFREAYPVVWTKTLRSQSRCNIFLPQRGCLAWSVAQPRRQRHPTVIYAFSGFLGVEVLPLLAAGKPAGLAEVRKSER